MNNLNLAASIKEKAFSFGYEKCGVISLADMSGYGEMLDRRIIDFPSQKNFLEKFRRFASPQQNFPWAKSIVICARHYGKFQVPGHLLGHVSSFYLLNRFTVPGSADFQASHSMAQFMKDLGLRVETGQGGAVAMRWAAQMAGLGLMRRNNFFYTKNGSKVFLEAWLIDRELELKEEHELKPCPADCQKCQEACPTKALSAPYSMCPSNCITFLTGFGGLLGAGEEMRRAVGQWIYGCDQCQDACPFNSVFKDQQPAPPDDLIDALTLEKIIELDEKTLAELLAPRFYYIPGAEIWRWKFNVLNAMKNSGEEKYRSYIEKAQKDLSPHLVF